ncbi:hypothetical protein A3A09_02105 [Candidatus Nomurabacteria bacterium RIFCSPLOWO2_01_FULL_42_20]|nr:MAG: hypothetical protein A3A09_02105 [Candidatus Nomurabacteria bacterium RIFCSPLOWO2_01_FULL_42_20]
MAELYSNSIFWIENDKIHPNPFQPRREFDETKLGDLAESIRQYGVLQPLTISRIEKEKEDGGIAVEYELIAGERRLRAAKLAGVLQVPCVIRVGDDKLAKLELAIIENLQREDLNSVDRARAFMRLCEEFDFTHAQIAQKIGMSREYVSNSMRLLALPEEILLALAEGKLSEGHTRPLLMLVDRKDEQMVLFKEIIFKKVSVREAEQFARRIASDRIRKKEYAPDPELIELEKSLEESLGTRVRIERKDFGGNIKIDFFSTDDLRFIMELLKSNQIKNPAEMLEKHIAQSAETATPAPTLGRGGPQNLPVMEDENDLYDIKNFSV